MIVWTGEATTAAVGIILSIYAMHRENRKDRRQEAAARAKVAADLKDRDEKWLMIMTEYVPHCHTETMPGEPLTKEGIRYPNTRVNGGR